jgi:hypothetical protein
VRDRPRAGRPAEHLDFDRSLPELEGDLQVEIPRASAQGEIGAFHKGLAVHLQSRDRELSRRGTAGDRQGDGPLPQRGVAQREPGGLDFHGLFTPLIGPCNRDVQPVCFERVPLAAQLHPRVADRQPWQQGERRAADLFLRGFLGGFLRGL